MRELELPPLHTPDCPRIAIVGAGRMGGALALALQAAGLQVNGPYGRQDSSPTPGVTGLRAGDPVDAVLLCVPDAEIRAAAATVSPGPLVGHCSGATGLDALSPHEAFSLHPLMTVTLDGADFTGAGAAVAGTTARALALARSLAVHAGMEPVEIDAADRVAYHAAASIASNFLVTLEAAAERLAATTGLERRLLAPLVRATVQNWTALGGREALTGPVARGDAATVAAQRAAVAERAPEIVSLFDCLVEATRALATKAPGARTAEEVPS
jgi:predicted short-subunit dehydrogenase-like oxidoreductase (DUF2520 family)